ncbi:MAG: ribonuclease HII, partial [Pseudomonadota bacterium]
DLIMQNACVGVGIANVDEIDRYNILGATKLAMLRAYENLTIKPDILLIDGNQLPNIDCKMEKVVGGDAISPSIAAASIIAKVTRDLMMCKIAEEFPEYGFERNSGYGTALHMQAIAKYGITKYHRKSFAPIKEVILKKAILDEQRRYA